MSAAEALPAIWLLDAARLESRLDDAHWWCGAGGVPEWEWAAALRYRHRKARLLHLSARHLARQVLGRTLGERPDKVPLVIGENGKPALAGGAIEFSLAHSDGLAACALATAPVGVDVERFDRAIDWRALADCHFSQPESQWLGARADRGGRRFIALWTLKESYIKALGQADSFAALRFRPSGAHCFTSSHAGFSDGSCRLIRALDAYCIAICTLETRCQAPALHWLDSAPWSCGQ